MNHFTEHIPTNESYWRAIILFGDNVATYKFALAKSLLELANREKVSITLEELADPFSRHICEHLKMNQKQTTSKSSAFLEECKNYNQGKTTYDSLIDVTVKKGFTCVLNAFHNVNRAPVPQSYFEVAKKSRTKSIVISDALLKLKETMQFNNLPHETEARWRLVETAWSLNVRPSLLQIQHDIDDELLFVKNNFINRINITSCRDALNGYQKGKCFYCFSDISVMAFSNDLADVDHFFPLTLAQFQKSFNFNGIWNLVLACKDCNRGVQGKYAHVPKLKYLERLHKRNNFLIDSHHPLRETLRIQTGYTKEERSKFLNNMHKDALNILIHQWQPVHELEPAF